MKSFAFALSLLSYPNVVGAAEDLTTDMERSTSVGMLADCPLQVELYHLQDVSAGFVQSQEVTEQIKQLIEELQAKLPSVKVALGSTVDKPVATLGYEAGRGGWQSTDWCYKHEIDFTTDSDEVISALQALESGGGADTPEGQFEAMIRAAINTEAGWTPPTIDVDPISLLPVMRVLLVVTDDTMHFEGDGPGAISLWNEKYGSETFCHGVYISESIRDICLRGGVLRQLIENGNATEDDIAEFEEVKSIVGPFPYDELKPHPGDLMGNEGCSEYDYPNWGQVRDVLEKNKINPIMLVANRNAGSFKDWEWFATQFSRVQAFAYQVAYYELLADAALEAITSIATSMCATTEEPSSSPFESSSLSENCWIVCKTA